MFIRIRVPSNLTAEKPDDAPAAYPIRKTSLLASVGIHSIVIACLFSGSPSGAVSRRPILDELVQPKAHKIIIYDFRKKAPEVEPVKQLGKFARPRGAEISKQTVIASSPRPKSSQQMIWLPTPQIQIQKDLPLPNLIARMKTSLPFAPVPSKEMHQPAAEAARAIQANVSPPDPKGDVAHAPEAVSEAAKAPKQVRTFVPPPPSREAKLPVPIQVSESPAPSPGSPANPLPPGAGTPSVFRDSSIPTSIAAVAPIPSSGNAKADIAVASLHPPADANTAMPTGSRPGRFSKAPETGSPASGEVGKPGAVAVPDLTVREDKTRPAKILPDPNRTRPVLYSERVRSIPAATLSVPLRPSSRTIPRAVDARFQGRNVYTMVVPIENLPAYAGDWIVWFAERQPAPGSTPLMRAPLPFRKMEPVDQAPSGTAGQARVQVSGVLDRDGRLEKLSILTRPSTMTEQGVVQDLQSWEFKPATRDGVPVDVEVVIEIPFNLPTAVAKRVQP